MSYPTKSLPNPNYEQIELVYKGSLIKGLENDKKIIWKICSLVLWFILVTHIIHINIHTLTHSHTHTQIHIKTHTLTYTHTNTHTHTHIDLMYEYNWYYILHVEYKKYRDLVGYTISCVFLYFQTFLSCLLRVSIC